jgi:hypothetical protein
VQVDGKKYTFVPADNPGLKSIMPNFFELARLGPGEFGMGLRLWCSKAIMENHADTECYANVTVKNGKISSFDPYYIRRDFISKPK